jgi:predicted RNA-binding protein associated with RNAse of E/G family
MSRLIHYSYSRPGKDTAIYDHQLVIDEPDIKVLLMEDYRGDPLVIEGHVVAEPGAALLWFVFPGVWHDIGRFHLADDTFTGWYTNLCTPVQIERNEWASTDLFLDHWMTPDGFQSWLDEDELADAVRADLVDDATQSHIAGERSRIQAHLDVGAWPPEIAVELDLEAARGLLEE